MNGVSEAFRTAMLDQTVHLSHAGSRGDEHQRAIGKFGQMGVAEGHLHPGHPALAQMDQQLDC